MTANAAEGVCAALPDFYPGRPERVVVRETHISWVFLAGDRAYKLKKPLVLGFLDYGTPERRREMCREEVRLNRWLAPDVYLSVRAVAATRAAFELVLAAILIYLPVFQRLLATAALDPDMLLFVAPFPFVGGALTSCAAGRCDGATQVTRPACARTNRARCRA